MENGVKVTRRTFLKSLAAIAGVSAVPALGVSLPSVTEPIKWIVQLEDYDSLLSVGAQWGVGNNMVRRAVSIDLPDKKLQAKSVEYCKQALRQWHYERTNALWTYDLR